MELFLIIFLSVFNLILLRAVFLNYKKISELESRVKFYSLIPHSKSYNLDK